MVALEEKSGDDQSRRSHFLGSTNVSMKWLSIKSLLQYSHLRIYSLKVHLYSMCWGCVHVFVCKETKGKKMSKELQDVWTDRASSSAYFQKPQGHTFSEVLNPRLDLCVSIYKSDPLLLQLTRPGMWDKSISWFGRCQWGTTGTFWLVEENYT